MLKCLTCWLTFCLVTASEAPPFWKSKSKVYERIQNREIIVSVTSPDKLLRVSGGGQIQRACSCVVAQTENPKELVASSSYVKNATYDEKSQRLEFTIAAFTREARLQLKLVTVNGPPPRRVNFFMESGPLSGFNGKFSFNEINSSNCEVGISGQYQYDHFPLPKFFLEFGLEVIFQRMALGLRTFVEDRCKEKGPAHEHS